MLPYIAEFLGTMILIILGDGVVANVNLNKSGMKGAGAVQITFAWGLAVGYWASKEDVIKNWAIDKTFEPKIADEEREKRIKGWNKAVKYAYGWAKED